MMDARDHKWNDKGAIVFLQVGTFLEYFDLMLYVHMAVVLNNLFFPKTDPHTAYMLSAFAFCSTYVFRPFGALLFGYIGDKYGRKTTLAITMLMMGIPCGVMTMLPTYEAWGYTSAVIITLCRICQGMSSLGEIVGAGLYLMETVKRPFQYFVVALLTVSSSLGSMVALIIASFAVASSQESWRLGFGFAFGIAFSGSAARMYLRETPEFSQAHQRLKAAIKAGNKAEVAQIERKRSNDTTHTLAEDHKTLWMYFLSQLCWPVCVYFSYIYCGDLLKVICHYTPADIIHQNFIVSISQLFTTLILTIMSYYIYPLKIIRFVLGLFFIFIFASPYFLDTIQESNDILITAYNARIIFYLQCLSVILTPSIFPAAPIFFSHFPILKRFKYASLPFAISRAIMHPIVSFGSVGAVVLLGSYWGLFGIFFPATIAFAISLYHFIKLEKASGNYPGFNKPKGVKMGEFSENDFPHDHPPQSKIQNPIYQTYNLTHRDHNNQTHQTAVQTIKRNPSKGKH